VPLALIEGGILAMPFLGFTGVDSGLKPALPAETATVETAPAAADGFPPPTRPEGEPTGAKAS